MPPSILTVNAGSSSLRFAIYEAGENPRLVDSGKIDRIGITGKNKNGGTFHQAVRSLLDWLDSHSATSSIQAVGHRIVHGMKRSEPARITPRLLQALRQIQIYDPDHLPNELALIESLLQRYPRWIPLACFDTAFHRTMPATARMLPISRRYFRKGVERYGFHGLSYAYLMEELRRLDYRAAQGRVILAHLGNGASLAAVYRGKSVDTTMSFTPAAGLMMGTRCGDLDPGLIRYFARAEHMNADDFDDMINHKSGLLGVSGISSDIRDLLAREAQDRQAAEALDLFSYQVRKWIGCFAAALGGLDTLVFAAGIGENAPPIRKRICDELGFLGLALDQRRNARSAPIISREASGVTVRVIRTNEEIMIARYVSRTLNFSSGKRK